MLKVLEPIYWTSRRQFSDSKRVKRKVMGITDFRINDVVSLIGLEVSTLAFNFLVNSLVRFNS